MPNTSHLGTIIEKIESSDEIQIESYLFNRFVTYTDIPRTIHGTQAKEGLLLFTPGGYEDDIVFRRFVLFEYNGYNIIIHSSGDENSIKKSMPSYFKKGSSSDEGLIWSDMESFSQKLETHAGIGAAQKWYDDFDTIINSIKFK